MDGGSPDMKVEMQHIPLLFEVVRSFTTLAETLNLSHAVRELGSTRQTVRRHITQLEEIKGGALFSVNDRQYSLTELGHKILPEALNLQARAEAWLHGRSRSVNGLQFLSQSGEDGWTHIQHQQPIGRVFTSSGTLLADSLLAWAEAGGDIEHPAMKAMRPYWMIFRRSEGSWIFTEVGEESSFTSWFGSTIARSTVGRVLGQLPGGHNLDRLVNEAYVEVEQTQSMRLDHCYTTIQNEEVGGLLPMCYERLLLGSRFADGSFAMVSVVRRTYDVEIMGVSGDMLRLMPDNYLM